MPRMSREIARPSRMKLWVRRQRRNLRLAGFAVSGFVLVLIGVTVAHSAQTGGTVAALERRFGQAIDLRVKDIKIDGRSNTPEPLLRAALSVKEGDPILGFSVEAARERIENLSWVEHVAVERRLPDTIYVDLTERRPFAIWQNQGRFQLIDRAGEVVTSEDVAAFPDLPLVVGLGAPPHAADMLGLMADHPDIRGLVAALVRVGERRWNLQLKNNITVMLPEGHEQEALARLSDLQAKEHLLDRPLVFVDMRLADRLAVRPRTPSSDTKPDDAKPADTKAVTKPAAKPALAKPREPASDPAKEPANRRAT
jgi:cell division protein FtsQ